MEIITKNLKNIIKIQERIIGIKDRQIHTEKKINKHLWEKYYDVVEKNSDWRFSYASLERHKKTIEIYQREIEKVYSKYDKIVPGLLKKEKRNTRRNFKQHKIFTLP